MKETVKNTHKAFLLTFFIVTSIFLSSFSYANDKEFADLVFPAKTQIPPSHLTQLTAKEFNKLSKQLKQPLFSDKFCFALVDKISAKDFTRYTFGGNNSANIVFSNYCGSEEIRNHFWIQKDATFNYVGFIEGTPLKFFINKSGIPSVITSKGWCCSGSIGSFILYNLQEYKGSLRYIPAKKIMKFSDLPIPEKQTLSVKFVVTQDRYRLRSTPEIIDKKDDDMSELAGQTVYGNIIAEFNKGAKGEAIAEYKDKKGNIWWFVLMDKNAKAITNHFYDDKDGYKTGWMKASLLKVKSK